MYVYAESSVRPEPVVMESSAVYNYVRRNIQEDEREENGETVTVFTYEEEKVRKENWELYEEVAQQRADIDFLAMNTDTDL